MRRIAVLIEADDSWGRRVVAAIAAYARSQQWRLLIGPRDHQHRLRLPRRWQGDGVIASLRDRAMADHVRRSRLPAVDVSIMMPQEQWLGRVATDDQARATMAFDHFRARGIEHFGCYAPTIGRYSTARVVAFQTSVEQAGYTCDVFTETRSTRGWAIDHDHVMSWLSRLPRPLGLFAADPYPARQLAEICDLNSIAVPDDVAILAGDNDDLLCHVTSPQLSAIHLACERIGTQAAELLQRLMNGGRIPRRPTLIPPLHVRARQSTDLLATSDPLMTEILRFISEHVGEGIGVPDVVKRFSLSRRNLEQRFRRQLNRSPAEHIRRVRLEQVRRLLLETDLSITQISLRTGFSESGRLSQQYKRHYGQTPTATRSSVH